jgi:23S rRNA G2069 N7-methylase RlmK/C1962 C5-methylase RlmI
VLSVLKAGSILFFSTNHQSFQPNLDGLKVSDAREITSRTIPEDYIHKRKTIHRCWQITV